MARPGSEEQLVRAHVWLYQSDVEWMRQTFGATLGTSQVIRALVRRTRREIETTVSASGKPIQQPSDFLSEGDSPSADSPTDSSIDKQPTG